MVTLSKISSVIQYVCDYKAETLHCVCSFFFLKWKSHMHVGVDDIEQS